MRVFVIRLAHSTAMREPAPAGRRGWRYSMRPAPRAAAAAALRPAMRPKVTAGP